MLCPSRNLFLLKLAYMITLDYGENMETFCGKCGDAAAKKMYAIERSVRYDMI